MDKISTEDLEKLLEMAYYWAASDEACLHESDPVDLLRRTAVLLGQDPIEVTPYDFKKKYYHKFEAWTSIGPNDPVRDSCRHCRGIEANSAHHMEV